MSEKSLTKFHRGLTEIHRDLDFQTHSYFGTMVIPNLLLIAGTGNKSGKTTIACRLIEQFAELKIIGIKITPALRNYVDPVLFMVMISDDRNKQKDISHLLKLPHVKLNLDNIIISDNLPVSFNNGKWICWKYSS